MLCYRTSYYISKLSPKFLGNKSKWHEFTFLIIGLKNWCPPPPFPSHPHHQHTIVLFMYSPAFFKVFLLVTPIFHHKLCRHSLHTTSFSFVSLCNDLEGGGGGHLWRLLCKGERTRQVSNTVLYPEGLGAPPKVQISPPKLQDPQLLSSTSSAVSNA